MKNEKAFSLMELIVAGIVASVIAVMAITTYSRTMELARLDDVLRQLTLIHAANQAFKARNWQYWPNDGGTHTSIAEINTELQLNIPTDAFDVYYFNGDGTTWEIEIHYPQGGSDFFAIVNNAPISDTNPRCNYSCP